MNNSQSSSKYQREYFNNQPVVEGTINFRITDKVFGRLLTLQDKTVEFVISVKESLRAEDLREAWGEIDAIREYLRLRHGSDFSTYNNSMWYVIDDLHQKGWSYLDIARELNFDLIVYLCMYIDEELRSCDEELAISGFIDFISIMVSMRFKNENILEIFHSGMAAIRMGEAPWLPENDPITSLKIRDVIRQYRKDLQTGKIVDNLEGIPGAFGLATSWKNTMPDKYVDEAIELLRISYPSYLDKHAFSFERHLTKKVDISLAAAAVENLPETRKSLAKEIKEIRKILGNSG